MRLCAAILGLIAAGTGALPAVAGRDDEERAGARLAASLAKAEARASVIPVVVIVPDARSYLGAIERWTPEARYPVLWDTGTTRSARDIARFVRAFGARQVVRWSSPDPTPFPAQPAARRELISQACRRAWDGAGTDDDSMMRQAWARAGAEPVGMVVADPGDPAWTAALAIASARAAPLVWVDGRGATSGSWDGKTADEYCARIEAAAQQTGLAWRGLDDDIDAVTYCAAAPVKIKVGEDLFALSDRVGRLADGSRWAWASQVWGDSARAAYVAMCGLFLSEREAWLFDSYPDEAPWNLYALRDAGRVLESAGWSVTLNAPRPGGLEDWRAACAPGLGAGLVMVNTKGNRDFFDLFPGRATPGEIPVLRSPAAAYFIHSWSANQPGEPGTVGGRWIEHGAWAYLGSVQEPFLQAFATGTGVASRLREGWPWGAAVRAPGLPAGKLASFGDAMARLGEPPAGTDPSGSTADGAGPALPLADAVPLSDRIPAALRAARFDEALREMLMSGRHEDAARLARALLRDQPGAIAPAIAEPSVEAAFLAGDAMLLVEMVQRLDPARDADGLTRDMLWAGVRAGLAAASPAEAERLVACLMQRLRDEQLGTDAVEVARLMETSGTRFDPVGFLQSVPTTRVKDRRIIDQELTRRGVKPR